mmetsp:Transcript_14350/g.17720  ORF Transcript_14350/g.17720 Transcript_14350/m.17720 type:complete len:294 (+) Transcript_14350:158-1039(+)|eukprot:CAMPEP_0204831416 /NCGR_PEP_ID=MMETSP1346-20131115/10642_1 /ASSEMBLY_ACC=CAM_ASM_000771 /TAXON_ID=215587 /ORGANISM="Aplanochytrium stocchinoi, Strain GSBS06" /LENGTH=293 /DNA_ID=CAMNT_0051962463 /DNA_START=215 /DNA_END=1096 /DNA_ORIENTATION=+
MVLEKYTPTAEHIQKFRAMMESSDVKSYEIENKIGTFEFDDLTLKKFLIARDGKFEKSQKMLEQHIKFRNTMKTWELGPKDIQKILPTGVWRLSPNNTKEGHAFLLTRTRDWDPSAYTVEEYEKCVTYMCLEAHKTAINPEKRSVTFFDLGGWSLRKGHASMKANRMSKKLIAVTQDNFPECNEKIIIWNAPMAFSATWKLLKYLIDPDTREKIVFTSDPKELLKYVDAANVPKEYGGTLDGDIPIPGIEQLQTGALDEPINDNSTVEVEKNLADFAISKTDNVQSPAIKTKA